MGRNRCLPVVGREPNLAAVLARLLLTLLLAAFAVPVASPAACHDAATSGAKTRHAMVMLPHEQPAKAIPVHGCIGCIPPTDWLAARIAAPSLTPAVAPSTVTARLNLRGGIPPALRPPRLA